MTDAFEKSQSDLQDMIDEHYNKPKPNTVRIRPGGPLEVKAADAFIAAAKTVEGLGWYRFDAQGKFEAAALPVAAQMQKIYNFPQALGKLGRIIDSTLDLICSPK